MVVLVATGWVELTGQLGKGGALNTVRFVTIRPNILIQPCFTH